MNARGGAVLYTPDILALAVELGSFPLDGGPWQRGEAVSRVCGSRIMIGLACDESGTVTRAGARVSACALGQAAAALFLQSAVGRSPAQIEATLPALASWLAGDDVLPDWPDIARLEAARPYSARHAAILLPWRAALGALSNPPHAD